jgi:hypothetical protein
MNSSRRWMVVFALVIGILVVATVSLVLFNNGKKVTLLPEDAPQGIVQRYLIAVQNKDYQQAANYLSFGASGPFTTYDDWLRSVTVMPETSNQTTWKATLGEVTQNGDYATVEVIIDTFRAAGVFGGSQVSQPISFQLTKTGNSWFITSPSYIYWIY